MDDVKKTWCAPVWLLDPERLERQLDRLSAEGWQLEGTGWLSFRYRRGAPNEYRYRVQYLYESRDGQKDDYVRGLARGGPAASCGAVPVLCGGLVSACTCLQCGLDGEKRERLSAILGGAHHRRRDSGIAVACHRDLCSPAAVRLREAAPQAAAGAAYRRIKEARLPRAAFLYAIFTG